MGRYLSVKVRIGASASPKHLALRFLSIQNPANGSGQPFPLAGFMRQLLASGFGELVETCFAIVFARAPFGDDPALILQSLQRGIKRAVIYQQFVIRLQLNGASDALTMLWAKKKSSQDQEIQRSLKNCDAVFFISGWHSA